MIEDCTQSDRVASAVKEVENHEGVFENQGEEPTMKSKQENAASYEDSDTSSTSSDTEAESASASKSRKGMLSMDSLTIFLFVEFVSTASGPLVPLRHFYE